MRSSINVTRNVTAEGIIPRSPTNTFLCDSPKTIMLTCKVSDYPTRDACYDRGANRFLFWGSLILGAQDMSFLTQKNDSKKKKKLYLRLTFDEKKEIKWPRYAARESWKKWPIIIFFRRFWVKESRHSENILPKNGIPYTSIIVARVQVVHHWCEPKRSEKRKPWPRKCTGDTYRWMIQ